MTMRSYDDIEFRPWYLPDTARWLKLSLGARGLVAELLRKLDRHGRIALGDDPAADLAVILRLDEDDTRAALTELLSAGRLVWDPVERLLSDPDLPARMRMGSAARMAKKRALDAEKAAKTKPANDAPPAPASHPSQPVTPVTSGHILSPSDLPLILSGSGSDLSEAREDVVGNRAREDRAFATGTASALEAKAAFESGVAAATGKPFTLGRAPYLVQDLCDAVNTHAPPELETKADVLRWLTTLVTTWCRATTPTTITPRRLLDWLNADRPTHPAKAGPPPDDPELCAHRDAYARGISSGKRCSWVWPGGRDAESALRALVAGHGKDDNGKAYRGEQLTRFVEHTASAFAADVIAQGRAEYFAAFAPSGCLRWLNEQHQAEEARHVG